MADPIVISDDSDSEVSSSHTPWRPPQPLDLNPGPSHAPILTPPLAITVIARANEARPETLALPANCDLSLFDPAVNLEPGTYRPMDLIDLTEDSGMRRKRRRSNTSVIDLTQMEDERVVNETVCLGGGGRRRNRNVVIEGLDSGRLVETVSSDLNFAVGDAGMPVLEGVATIPKIDSHHSLASAQVVVCRHEFQEFLSPTSKACTSCSNLEPTCSTSFKRGDVGSFGSFHQAPGPIISSVSCSSIATTVPCMLENFYHVLLDSSEERGSDIRKPEPICQGRLQIINNTIEANFPEATVQCLEEFVTPQFYPPKEILSYVIRNILLSPDVGNLLDRTYRQLTKIQELHPATLAYVEWDWELLTSVMQEGRHLPGQIFFLRYVLQTLEQNLHEVLKQPQGQLQNTIACSVLSCDKKPHNVKNIIRWLVETLSGPNFPLTDNFPHHDSKSNQASALAPRAFDRDQMVVLYLQKMLAMAVEVDRSPTCTSNKIAEMLFGFVINIPERNQRDTFFTSIENHLLRCKVLEIILLHSCEQPTTLPLSFAQILYFLNNATSMYNHSENLKWERWDELVEHLQFLLISYQRVTTEHLRISIQDRKDMCTKFRQQTQQGDDITALDVELQIEGFRGRMGQLVGGVMPFHLQENLFLLKLLLLQAIHRKPLLENRFQGGHLMKAYSLLDQEYPDVQ